MIFVLWSESAWTRTSSSAQPGLQVSDESGVDGEYSEPEVNHLNLASGRLTRRVQLAAEVEVGEEALTDGEDTKR